MAFVATPCLVLTSLFGSFFIFSSYFISNFCLEMLYLQFPVHVGSSPDSDFFCSTPMPHFVHSALYCLSACWLSHCCNAERFFGLGSESTLEDMQSPPQSPGVAVLTMLRALSYFTICLVESEEKLGKAKQVLKSALRLGVDTALLMKEYTKAEDRLAIDKSWFGETIAFGLMRWALSQVA